MSTVLSVPSACCMAWHWGLPCPCRWQAQPWELWLQTQGCREGTAIGAACADSQGWCWHTGTRSGGCTRAALWARMVFARHRMWWWLLLPCSQWQGCACNVSCLQAPTPISGNAAASALGRAPHGNVVAPVVTQRCRWQPGPRQPPRRAGSAAACAGFSLPVGLMENDSAAAIRAIGTGKSCPRQGIPWHRAHPSPPALGVLARAPLRHPWVQRPVPRGRGV